MNHTHFNLANAVTCVRFALVPFFLYAAWVDMRLAMLIFFIAAASDWLDGYLARRLRCHSALGALLDPLADKCMSWAALLVINLYLQQFMLACASLCIVLRDLYLSAQRLYYFTDNRYAPALQVSPLAKIKTALLFFSQLLLTFYIYAQNELVYSIGIVLLYASCLLTLISFGRYLRPKRI